MADLNRPVNGQVVQLSTASSCCNTMSAREISQAAEIVPDRLYYVALRQCPRQTPHAHFFTVDNTLVYWNFFLDFGV